MPIKWEKHFIQIIMFVLLVSSCISSLTEDWKFTGDTPDLLLEDSEIPLGWKLNYFSHEPFDQGDYAATAYVKSLEDKFGTQSIITHKITIFEHIDDAQVAFDTDYQRWFEILEGRSGNLGLPQENLAPPQKYTYTSPIANEFKVIYQAERGRTGQVVGYSYTVWARYGNVISWFVAFVADKEITQVGPEDANILSWAELESLLKRIDEKFKQAGKNQE